MTYSEYRNQAIADLKNYNELKRGAANLESRIDFLKNSGLYSSADTQTKVMASFEGDSHIVRHLSQIEAMENKLYYSRLYIANIENALSLLSAREKELLTSFYINRQRMSVTRLAQHTYTDRTWLYRLAQKALDRYIYNYFGVTRGDCA